MYVYNPYKAIIGIFHQSGFHHLHPVHNSQTNSCLINIFHD